MFQDHVDDENAKDLEQEKETPQLPVNNVPSGKEADPVDADITELPPARPDADAVPEPDAGDSKVLTAVQGYSNQLRVKATYFIRFCMSFLTAMLHQ